MPIDKAETLEKVATIKAKERGPCREHALVTRMDLSNRVGTGMLPSASLLLQDTCLNFFADEHTARMRARHEVARSRYSPSNAQTIAECGVNLCGNGNRAGTPLRSRSSTCIPSIRP